MQNYGKLAYTGIPSITVGGVVLGQWGLIAGAVLLVATGALLVRFVWRGKKSVSQP